MGLPGRAALVPGVNSALTEFAYTPKRHMLVSYNHLPHLDAPERRDWVSYS